MIRKLVPKGCPDYTKAAGSSVVVTIEAIYAIEDEGNEAREVIEQLQQYGAARVIKRRVIAEGFDEAAKILDRRAAFMERAKGQKA